MGRGLGSGQKWFSASGTAKFAMKVYKVHRDLRAQDFNSRIRVTRPHPPASPGKEIETTFPRSGVSEPRGSRHLFDPAPAWACDAEQRLFNVSKDHKSEFHKGVHLTLAF